MRRFGLTSLAALSLVALVAACATSPDEDLIGPPMAETAQAQPEEEGAKLPPPSNTAQEEKDAGSSPSPTKDAGTQQQKDASTPPPQDAGGGGVGPACDLSDPVKALFYQVQIAQQSSPVPCPGSASQCCYLGVTCVNP